MLRLRKAEKLSNPHRVSFALPLNYSPEGRHQMQVDWVGDMPQKKCKDIRNTQAQDAERKAVLCKSIKDRCNTIPEILKGDGTIDQVRKWKTDRETALKFCASRKSSVGDLEAALNLMARYE
jgi:hypothetical protein